MNKYKLLLIIIAVVIPSFIISAIFVINMNGVNKESPEDTANLVYQEYNSNSYNVVFEYENVTDKTLTIRHEVNLGYKVSEGVKLEPINGPRVSVISDDLLLLAFEPDDLEYGGITLGKPFDLNPGERIKQTYKVKFDESVTEIKDKVDISLNINASVKQENGKFKAEKRSTFVYNVEQNEFEELKTGVNLVLAHPRGYR